MSEIVKSISDLFPRIYVENENGGGTRQFEFSYSKGQPDELEIEITVQAFGQYSYEYAYLDREDIPTIIQFLQEFYDEGRKGTEAGPGTPEAA